MNGKALNNRNMEDAKKTTLDLEVFGDPGVWRLLCKVSSNDQGWMKSTKVMELKKKTGKVYGCLFQVTTQFRDEDYEVSACAEAVTFVPSVSFADIFGDTDE